MTGVIRAATIADTGQINHIANWYIENTVANFETEPWSIKKRTEWVARFCRTGSPYHLLVTVQDGAVVGFACNTRFKPKTGYDSSTETTVYIARGMTLGGRGEALYRALLERVGKQRFHRAYAVIALPNAPSIRLHEKLGFRLVGTLDEVGKKFGRFHDTGIYQKKL